MYQEFALTPHSTIKQQLAFRLGVKGQNVIENARKRAQELGISDMDLDEMYRMTDMPEENGKEKLAKMVILLPYLASSFPAIRLQKY